MYSNIIRPSHNSFLLASYGSHSVYPANHHGNYLYPITTNYKLSDWSRRQAYKHVELLKPGLGENNLVKVFQYISWCIKHSMVVLHNA